MDDKLSHWLQGGALVAALVGLVIASRRSHTAVQAAQTQASTPANSTLSFGNPSLPGVDPSVFNIGGDPIYLTYNYPDPTNVSQGVGTIAANPSNPPPLTAPVVKPRKRGSGCCGCEKQQTSASLAVTSDVDAQLAGLMSVSHRRWAIAPPTFHVE